MRNCLAKCGQMNLFLTFVPLVDSILKLFNLKAIRQIHGKKFWYPKVVIRSNFMKEIQELFLQLRPYSNGYPLIRIGEDGDGGYLVPNDLSGIDGCFSAGSDKIMHFEKHLAFEYGIKSYILDKIEKKPKDLTDLQEFRDGWLGTENNDETVTLESWLSEVTLDNSNELLLQMDIEGAEYQTLMCTPSNVLEKFRIIVTEFHSLNNFIDYNGFQNLYKPVFYKLLEGFDVVHFHANNCCGNWQVLDFEIPRVVEVTFHRKDRRLQPLQPTVTPNLLDQKNVAEMPDIQINWEEIVRKSENKALKS